MMPAPHGQMFAPLAAGFAGIIACGKDRLHGVAPQQPESAQELSPQPGSQPGPQPGSTQKSVPQPESGVRLEAKVLQMLASAPPRGRQRLAVPNQKAVNGNHTNSPEPRTCWSALKTKLRKEGSESATRCSQLEKQFADDRQGNQFRVTFKRAKVQIKKTSEKTSEKILAALHANPAATISDLANQAGVTTRTIERTLTKLQQASRLVRVGAAKGGHWKVRHSK